MKRAMWTLAVAAVVALAAGGAVSACGDTAKEQPVVAQADVKEGCGKSDCVGADCGKADCGKTAVAKAEGVVADGAMPDCGKAAVIANADGAAVQAVTVETATAKPCAGAGCSRKAKAAEVAKTKEAKPVEVAKNAK